ncbi:Bromodomain protein [Ancylostoma caninum]|uniref:Bromodomain protein n=1 Tax=Ancylostoma caninum TaxID=29170 RepID=A0A368GM43_ANCCA|nr:Bromodomain protein [Ancylostoma caninum]
MSSFSVKPWSNLEHLTLFQLYKADSKDNWHVRAAEEMDATRRQRVEGRPKGFFTPANCKAEFDRVMSEPCPSDVPTGANYSRAAVVEAWLAHFWEEDKKDAEQYEELQNVKIRYWMDRIASLQANRNKLTDEQYEKMYEDVVREDEEVEYDEDEKEFRELYATICIDYLKKADENKNEASSSRPSGRLPPTRPPDQSPLGPKTAFRSPSPSSSPLKSPARSTVDSEEPSTVPKIEEDHVEPMEVDEPKPLDHESTADTSSRNTPSSQPDQQTKRPRGRPPKKAANAPQFVKDSSTPVRDASPASSNAADEKKSPARTETRRSSARNESATTPAAAEKDSIHVVDSPAGNSFIGRRVRGARRPIAVDSPLVTKSSNAGRTSAGADAKKEDSKEDATSRESGDSTHQPIVLPSTDVIVDEFGGTTAQTALSIRMPLRNSSDSEHPPSRKSSRSDRRSTPITSTPSTSSSSRCDAAVQTDSVRFDMEDSFVIGYPLSDLTFGPPNAHLSTLIVKQETEVIRSAHCSNDHTSRIVSWNDVFDGSFRKKHSTKRVDSSTSLEEQAHIWHIVANEFSDPQAVKDYALNHSVGEMFSLSLVGSPPKRMRKEEKTSGSAPTPKSDKDHGFQGRMLSMWNILHEHRHSAIFLHPVTDRDAPGYSRAVYYPVDLTTVKREADSGTISVVNAFTLKIFLMFANAVMFNSTGHDVNFYAKEMGTATIDECMFIVSEIIYAVWIRGLIAIVYTYEGADKMIRDADQILPPSVRRPGLRREGSSNNCCFFLAEFGTDNVTTLLKSNLI